MATPPPTYPPQQRTHTHTYIHTQVEAPTNPNRLIAQADVEQCEYLADFLQQRVEREGDEELRDAQALLVIWPGLKAPGSYMLTCG
jgi:hypothetical protein